MTTKTIKNMEEFASASGISRPTLSKYFDIKYDYLSNTDILIESKNLNSKVSFIEQVNIDLIPSIVSKADSLFLSLKRDPIFSKTVPAKLQTYMAMGKPIIGVLEGEAAKLIIDSDCGIVEESYNYEELAKKINNFACTDNLEKIGRAHV